VELSVPDVTLISTFRNVVLGLFQAKSKTVSVLAVDVVLNCIWPRLVLLVAAPTLD
jgi:hypothetical protein